MNLNSASRAVTLRPKPAAQLRLFCFPNAGGGAALLHSWLNGLSEEIDLCPIHLPGRERRLHEPPFVRMDALVRTLLLDLEPYLDIPFALFGHSIGSLMAFEMAREIRRRGLRSPVRLFVSAHAAPQIPRAVEPIHQLEDPEFVEALIRRYDAIPSVILADKKMMEMFIPALKSDMEIMETYTYRSEPPLPCPISALGGVLDSTVATSQLGAWQQQTAHSFRLHMFPGKHFFLKEARPQVLSAIFSDLS
jgi:surfactin synthase thioesterase subunit